MRRHVLCSAITLLAFVGGGASGCKKDEEKKGAPATEQATGAGLTPVPKDVALFVGLKNPARTIDEGLAFVGQFVQLPLSRDGLIDLLAQRARLARDLVQAVDKSKPLWLIGLDEGPRRKVEDRRYKESEPAVMVFPLADRQQFLDALAQRYEAGKTEQGVVQYEPKPGQVGVQPVKLALTDTHVYAPTSVEALVAARAFIEGNLLARAPEHDVVGHVMVRHLLRGREGELDRELSKALDRMRGDMQREAGPVDREQVVSATAQTLRRWMDALKSTSEAVLHADISRDQLSVAVQGEAAAGGRLAELIKRQAPGAPFGYELLPADSWLVLADRGNEAAASEGKETWRPVLRDLLESLPQPSRERILSAVGDASDSFTGDFTLALHQPAAGAGITLSAVARVKDAEKTNKAVRELASALGAWLEESLASSAETVPQGVKVDRQELAIAGARGELFQLHLPVKHERRRDIERTVGLPITLGVAFSGEHAVLSIGQGARAQLEQMAAGVKQGKVQGSLDERAPFKRAMAAAKNRVGLLYLSVVDLFRWLAGTGLGDVGAIASALEGQKVESAPSLDWGVDEERKRFDVTLRVPAEHFEPFKPIIEKMQRGGGGGARVAPKQQPGSRDF